MQKAGERPSTVQAESSPSTESPNASSQQVLPLVPNSTSGQIFCFLPWPVLHIQAPPLTPIAEYPPSILTLRVEPTPQLVCTLINARSPGSRACKRRSMSATHHPDHRPKNWERWTLSVIVKGESSHKVQAYKCCDNVIYISWTIPA